MKLLRHSRSEYV